MEGCLAQRKKKPGLALPPCCNTNPGPKMLAHNVRSNGWP